MGIVLGLTLYIKDVCMYHYIKDCQLDYILEDRISGIRKIYGVIKIKHTCV